MFPHKFDLNPYAKPYSEAYEPESEAIHSSATHSVKLSPSSMHKRPPRHLINEYLYIYIHMCIYIFIYLHLSFIYLVFFLLLLLLAVRSVLGTRGGLIP